MVVGFGRIRKEDVMTVGGKGANLGEMVSAGIKCAKGLCSNCGCLQEFLKINSLRGSLQKRTYRECARGGRAC